MLGGIVAVMTELNAIAQAGRVVGARRERAIAVRTRVDRGTAC
jgi:hypothetical protein